MSRLSIRCDCRSEAADDACLMMLEVGLNRNAEVGPIDLQTLLHLQIFNLQSSIFKYRSLQNITTLTTNTPAEWHSPRPLRAMPPRTHLNPSTSKICPRNSKNTTSNATSTCSSPLMALSSISQRSSPQRCVGKHMFCSETCSPHNWR